MSLTTHPSKTLGADIRALRKARGTTLEALAAALDRSVGWLSQVERDLSAPSIDDLHKFAQALDVPLSLFFGQAETPEAERGYVVRSKARRAIGTADGLTESLLSPDLTDDFEVIHCVFAASSRSAAEVKRDTQELVTLTKGALTVWIAGRRFDLKEGDSFRIKGEAYSWENHKDQPAEAIWVISPPVY